MIVDQSTYSCFYPTVFIVVLSILSRFAPISGNWCLISVPANANFDPGGDFFGLGWDAFSSWVALFFGVVYWYAFWPFAGTEHRGSADLIKPWCGASSFLRWSAFWSLGIVLLEKFSRPG